MILMDENPDFDHEAFRADFKILLERWDREYILHEFTGVDWDEARYDFDGVGCA
jgi:hypothetical protein